MVLLVIELLVLIPPALFLRSSFFFLDSCELRFSVQFGVRTRLRCSAELSLPQLGPVATEARDVRPWLY